MNYIKITNKILKLSAHKLGLNISQLNILNHTKYSYYTRSVYLHL